MTNSLAIKNIEKSLDNNLENDETRKINDGNITSKQLIFDKIIFVGYFQFINQTYLKSTKSFDNEFRFE